MCLFDSLFFVLRGFCHLRGVILGGGKKMKEHKLGLKRRWEGSGRSWEELAMRMPAGPTLYSGLVGELAQKAARVSELIPSQTGCPLSGPAPQQHSSAGPDGVVQDSHPEDRSAGELVHPSPGKFGRVGLELVCCSTQVSCGRAGQPALVAWVGGGVSTVGKLVLPLASSNK